MIGIRWTVIIAIMAIALVPVLSWAGAFPAELAQTGIRDSYYPGDDGDLQVGVIWPDPRFTIIHCDEAGPCPQKFDCDWNPDSDVILDNLTGLVWARDTRLLGTNQVLWEDTIDFANNLSLCGYDDWRLPNLIELDSLVNLQKGPVMDSSPPGWWFERLLEDIGFTNSGVFGTFPNTPIYWTSTAQTDSGFPDPEMFYAWAVDNYDMNFRRYKHFINVFPTYYGYGLPVRGPDGVFPVSLWKTGVTMSMRPGDDGDLQKGVSVGWPDPRFVEEEQGTAVDRLTGLMWLTKAKCPLLAGYGDDIYEGALPWNEALDFVAAINSGSVNISACTSTSYTDWRVPNYRELLSLIDFSYTFYALPEGNPFPEPHPT